MHTLITRAVKTARTRQAPVYIYCTAVRWRIETTPPAFNRQYIMATPTGAVTLHEYDYQGAAWAVTPVTR